MAWPVEASASIPIGPLLTRVDASLKVELVDESGGFWLLPARGALEHREGVLPSGEMATLRIPYFVIEVWRSPPRNGFCGDFTPGSAMGRLEHAALGIRVNQEWAELVAEPERAVVSFAERFDVKIATGQEPARLDARVNGDHRSGVDIAVRNNREVDWSSGSRRVRYGDTSMEPDPPRAVRKSGEIR